jgi:hypothetical protein
MKEHSQDKRVKQNKKQTKTFTGVIQCVTSGHHAQWNNYMHKAYSNDIENTSKV